MLFDLQIFSGGVYPPSPTLPRSFNVNGLWAAWPLLKSCIPGKIDMVRVRSSNFACACSAVTSLVPLERKETQLFFWYKFEKKYVGTRAPPSFFGLLGTSFRSFAEDRAKRPVGMKARLARSLGGFCTL